MNRLKLALAVALIVLAGLARPVRADGPTATPSAFQKLPEPVEGKYDEKIPKAIDLKKLPALPDLAPYADTFRAIFAEGQKQGLDATVFSKFGDCMTASDGFLLPFAKQGSYDLGTYTALQPVIDYFSKTPVRSADSKLNSFSNPSLAAAAGFNAANILDSTWSDPKLCGADESPQACELRISKPAFVIILFGTNDLKSLTPDQFDLYLRKVIVDTVNAGAIPLISTFPNQPGLVDRSIYYNQIVAAIAQDYKLPLFNLWLAFDPLPDQGIDPKQPTHMTLPASGNPASFKPEDLKGGHNVHNLLTLQALDATLKVLNINVVAK